MGSKLVDDTLEVNQQDRIYSDKENDTQDNKQKKIEVEKNEQSDKTNISIKPINENDYIISKQNNRIELDTNYSDLEMDLLEINMEQNYVREVVEEEYTYQYYQQRFHGIVIYTSNLYYNEKERDINDYYISQITVTSSEFETSRGVKIGNTYNNIINVYGKDGIEESGSIIYKYKDKNLKFNFNDMDLLSEIILYVENESNEEEKGYLIDDYPKIKDDLIKKNTKEDRKECNDEIKYNLFGYLDFVDNNYILIGGTLNNKFYYIDDIKENLIYTDEFNFYSIDNVKSVSKYCEIKNNNIIVSDNLSQTTNENLDFFMNDYDNYYSTPVPISISDINNDEYNNIIMNITNILESYELNKVAIKNIKMYEVDINPNVDKERIIMLSNLLFVNEEKHSNILDDYNEIGAYSLMLYQSGDIINVIDKRITYLTRNDFVKLTKEEESIEFEKQKNIYKKELGNMVQEDQYIKGGQIEEGPYIYIKDSNNNEICVKPKTFVMMSDWSNYAKHYDYLKFIAVDLNNDNYKEIIVQDDYIELDLHFRTIYIYNLRNGEPKLEIKRIL
jgi:hypothetical protein